MPGLLEAKKSVRYQYLKDNREKYNIKKACKTLGISQSGFYEYLGRKPSKRDKENEVLSERIRSIFEKNDGRYGSIRISKSLEREGLHVNHKRVARLMRGMGLYAKGTRIRYRHYHRHAGNEERPNLVNQCFTSPAPNKVWLGDITYIGTKEGFLYLAVFVCYTLKTDNIIIRKSPH